MMDVQVQGVDVTRQPVEQGTIAVFTRTLASQVNGSARANARCAAAHPRRGMAP